MRPTEPDSPWGSAPSCSESRGPELECHCGMQPVPARQVGYLSFRQAVMRAPTLLSPQPFSSGFPGGPVAMMSWLLPLLQQLSGGDTLELTALPAGASAGTLAPSEAGPHRTHQFHGHLGVRTGCVSRRLLQELPVWRLTPLTPQTHPGFSRKRK